ncbi:peptidoglycan bridge formation glycyltransferase FemA/FemB family protein [Candidatus Magnetaquicoccus inordinatus]|uniref:peptidoglycan bridge formation glycyltransferase FemA/FemB family protein n=1 Tax=Candidatus Magnetaquicoccus inordinatus TaxID=2496818 RepID=UPI00187D564A|nr:peptidoglycan bridge formation glycyltransferase FemA/FemB family protein [Candidatus Magnetaquicoccus inordinatus]
MQEVGYSQWQQHWQNATLCTLTQSWEYGSAMAQHRLCRGVRFAITDQHGCVRGLLQCLHWSVPWLGGVLRINRGPLCCASSWSLEEQEQFLLALRELAHKRRYRAIFLAPPWPDQTETRLLLQQQGFRLRHTKIPWGSHRLDLQQEMATLRCQLSGKWRNLLVKSERQRLLLRWESPTLCWDRFVGFYSQFVLEKQFVGVDARLLGYLARQHSPAWRWNLLTASLPDSPDEWIALLVSVYHGDTASYLLAANREEGRRLLCNYQLLWLAIGHAHSQGLDWFDLGGVDAATPEGIRHFKSGLSGIPYQWVGEWSLLSFLPKRGET